MKLVLKQRLSECSNSALHRIRAFEVFATLTVI